MAMTCSIPSMVETKSAAKNRLFRALDEFFKLPRFIVVRNACTLYVKTQGITCSWCFFLTTALARTCIILYPNGIQSKKTFVHHRFKALGCYRGRCSLMKNNGCSKRKLHLKLLIHNLSTLLCVMVVAWLKVMQPSVEIDTNFEAYHLNQN